MSLSGASDDGWLVGALRAVEACGAQGKSKSRMICAAMRESKCYHGGGIRNSNYAADEVCGEKVSSAAEEVCGGDKSDGSDSIATIVEQDGLCKATDLVDRMQCIEAVVAKKIAGVEPSFLEKLRRNVAEHAYEVSGVGAMSATDLRRAQKAYCSTWVG